MSRSTLTQLIEPGDLVYVRGCYPAFLVLEVHQGQALVSDADAWVKHRWVPLDACHLAENRD